MRSVFLFYLVGTGILPLVQAQKHPFTFEDMMALKRVEEPEGTPEAEDECNVKKLDEVKNSKVKALIFTHLLYRHWNAYKEGKRTHLFVVPADLGALGMNHRALYPVINDARDLTPGDYDAPVFSLGGQDDYAFSPDGQEICYASNHDPAPAASTNNDLLTVPVNLPADAT